LYIALASSEVVYDSQAPDSKVPDILRNRATDDDPL